MKKMKRQDTKMITIWHNSRCGKSRDGKKLLEEKGIEIEVYEYLKEELKPSQIKEIIKMLGINDIREMLRTKESAYKENNLKDKSLTTDQTIDIVIKYPKLIERPIFINNGKAVIARPAELALDIL
jgi:arsenate reductase